MTTRPRIVTDSSQVVGLLALALFGVLSVVFLTASFGDPTGFTGDGSITASIGYALLNIADGGYQSEGFLVALIIIAIVLDAAIDGAVMLARREEGGAPEGAREVRDRGTYHHTGDEPEGGDD